MEQGGVCAHVCGPCVSRADVSGCLCLLFPSSLGSRHIRVYLPPLDSGTPNTYCSKALKLQAPLIFNEVFRIPVHSSMVTLKSLQLYVCSVNLQLQEELLVRRPPPPLPLPPLLPVSRCQVISVAGRTERDDKTPYLVKCSVV